MAVVGSASFWLGLSSGRERTEIETNSNGESEALAVPRPGPAGELAAAVSGIDPLATTSGLTWAIYASQDRLSDHAIFGARFGTASGTPLFTVLCAEGQGALSLKRGLLPAAEGASQNSGSTLEAIRVGVRIGERERDRVEVRFEADPPESLEAIPKNPAEFLDRVTASQKIRTANDTFDPSTWADAIARVKQACGFATRPGVSPQKAKPKN
jgi:hypothetical protein